MEISPRLFRTRYHSVPEVTVTSHLSTMSMAPSSRTVASMSMSLTLASSAKDGRAAISSPAKAHIALRISQIFIEGIAVFS